MSDEHEKDEEHSPEFVESMNAAFGEGNWNTGVDVPPMTPGDFDMGFDEDGNDVTITMLDEKTAAVEVTDEVHNVLDARLVEAEEGFGAHQLKADDED